MIFSSEPGASPILAADKNLDITDRVVARLRTMAAAKPDTKTKAGAPTSTPSGVTRPRPPA
jgi:outer membrane protein